MASQNDIIEISNAVEYPMNNDEFLKVESIKAANNEKTENVNENKNIREENIETPHKGSFFIRTIKNIRVQVTMFLYMFSYTMRLVSSTTMILDKVCLVHLGYSNITCKNLSEELDIKITVEKIANNYSLALTILQTAPSALTIMFLGSWSDKYSRKIPIIIALIGITIDGVGTSICAYFMNSRVEYFLIPAIFTGISGGYIGVLTVLYSYTSDITTIKNRTRKFVLVELAAGLSMPLGSLAGGWFYNFFGYVTVFVTSTCGFFLCLLWVIFFLEETKGLDNTDNWKTMFRNFWSTEFIVSGFKAAMKIRPNKGRAQIWWLITSLSIAGVSPTAASGVMYFYVHHQYNWDNTTLSTVSAIFAIAGVSTLLVVVTICLKFQIQDSKMSTIGSISLLLKNLGLALSFDKGIFYLANAVGLISPLTSLGGRPRLSKVTSKEDQGKIFGFLTTAEAIIPVLATAMISQVFNATLDFYAGLIFLVVAVLNLIPLGTFIWITRLSSKNKNEMICYEEYEQISEQKLPDTIPK